MDLVDGVDVDAGSHRVPPVHVLDHHFSVSAVTGVVPTGLRRHTRIVDAIQEGASTETVTRRTPKMPAQLVRHAGRPTDADLVRGTG